MGMNFDGRVLVGDTETTGMGPDHKMIEIALVERVAGVNTGKNYHEYLDPGREVDFEAEQVHGWDRESLVSESGGQTFPDVAEALVQFVNGAIVCFHNAQFDTEFLDRELQACGYKPLSEYCTVVDTLEYARRLYPGKANNLDALCKRLKVDRSNRTLHGALIDSDILADVLFAMLSPKENQEMLFGNKAGGQAAPDWNGKNREQLQQMLLAGLTPMNTDLATIEVSSTESEADTNFFVPAS